MNCKIKCAGSVWYNHISRNVREIKSAIFDSFCFKLLTFVLDNISASMFVELVIT